MSACLSVAQMLHGNKYILRDKYVFILDALTPRRCFAVCSLYRSSKALCWGSWNKLQLSVLKMCAINLSPVSVIKLRKVFTMLSSAATIINLPRCPSARLIEFMSYQHISLPAPYIHTSRQSGSSAMRLFRFLESFRRGFPPSFTDLFRSCIP